MIHLIKNICHKHGINTSKELLKDLSDLINQKDHEHAYKYDLLFNNSHLCYQSLDVNGNIIEVNSTWLNTLEYQKEEVLGKWFGDFLLPEDIESFKGCFNQFKQDGTAENIQYKLKKNNGEFILASFKTCSIYNPDGKFNYTFWSFTDITQKTYLLNQLKESEEKYRRLTENSPEITYINNIDKGALFWSSRVKDILGFNPNNIVEETNEWTNSIHPNDKPKIDGILKNVQAGKTYELEYRICDIHKNLHWFHDRIFNVYEKNGDLILEGIISDITENKRIDKEIKESEEKFRTITNAAQDAIILIDDKENVVFWNKAAEVIFQFTEAEVKGENLHLLITPVRYREKQIIAFEKFVKTGKGNAINNILELFAVRKDGVEIPVELSLSALKLNDKWHSVGVIRDISIRKRNEQKIQDKNKELYQLNATKDKFFSIIAHDLRGPISNLAAFSELLAQNFEQYNKERLSYIIHLMNTSSKQTLSLLENLLIWSQSQRNKIIFNPQSYRCNDLITEVIQEMEHLVLMKNLKLIATDKIQDYRIQVDKNMFKTIFRNLISNAIKYTKEGGEISIGCGKVIDNYMEIFVKDTGVGISENNLEKLFKIDENITTAGTNQETGSGLGLLLCKEFTDKHNGKIWIESKINAGSTFWLTLPLSRE